MRNARGELPHGLELLGLTELLFALAQRLHREQPRLLGTHALREVDVDAQRPHHTVAHPDRGEDVVDVPRLAAEQIRLIPVDGLARQRAPIVEEPRLEDARWEVLVLGALVEEFPPVRAGRRVQADAVSLPIAGPEVERQALDGRGVNRLALAQLPLGALRSFAQAFDLGTQRLDLVGRRSHRRKIADTAEVCCGRQRAGSVTRPSTRSA